MITRNGRSNKRRIRV